MAFDGTQVRMQQSGYHGYGDLIGAALGTYGRAGRFGGLASVGMIWKVLPVLNSHFLLKVSSLVCGLRSRMRSAAKSP